MSGMKATLPVRNPTHSYWQTRPHKLAAHSSDFIEDADTVIIGSGVTGTLIAHHLLERDHGIGRKALVMLEARELCSGATGRNGGHIKPDCYRGFLDFEATYGPEVARLQCELDCINREEFSQFIRSQGLAEEVDMVELRAADCYMSDEAWTRGLDSYHAFQKAGGAVDGLEVLDSKTSQEKLRVEGCKGAITYPAYTLWPYKLVTSLIARCIEQGLRVHTNTPALEISPSPRRNWRVETPQGPIHCDRIIHATNGYATYLLPEFCTKIVPLKGHVVAVDPGQTYSETPLTHSYAFQWGEDFDYLIQRPNDGQPLIYGGGDISHPAGLMGGVGDSDDSSMSPEIITHLEDHVPKIFVSWDRPATHRQAWSGIMGLTPDELPFVGEIPSKKGQYIVGGFNGHGMARGFMTVRAFCQLFHGDPIDARVPAPYFEVEARLQTATPHWDDFLERARASHRHGAGRL